MSQGNYFPQQNQNYQNGGYQPQAYPHNQQFQPQPAVQRQIDPPLIPRQNIPKWAAKPKLLMCLFVFSAIIFGFLVAERV